MRPPLAQGQLMTDDDPRTKIERRIASIAEVEAMVAGTIAPQLHSNERHHLRVLLKEARHAIDQVGMTGWSTPAGQTVMMRAKVLEWAAREIVMSRRQG